MQRFFGLLAVAGCLFAAGDETGIRPRPSATDYPAHAAASGVTVAASVVPKDQVSKLFATDLNKEGYIVMEVGVFPAEGRDVKLATRDFMLIAGTDGTAIRPAEPDAIAARFDRKYEPKDPRLPGNVQVYPSATIGYERGTYNGRSQSGVYTGAGVGVGVGDPGPMPPPGASGPDGYEIRRELQGKSLPEGTLDHAVAGYVYFPKPPKKAGKEGYRLTWYGPDSQVHLTVPLPHK